MKGFEDTAPDRRTVRELRLDIEEFNTAYCAALDEGRIGDWPGFFAENALYRITGRENADADLPVGLVYCEGMGMLKDRALAIARSMMFAPRYLQHLVGNVRVLAAPADGPVAAQANYALFETLVDAPTRILQTGRYYDRFIREGSRLLLAERHCVYDSLIIDTALIYPV